jgi:nucleoside-diphosphate-sugar epimerase
MQIMNILLTGAFGNVGSCTLQELLRQGQTVRCFDLKSARAENAARQLEGKVEIIWGDLRNPQEVATAVKGQDIILHLGYAIPPATINDPKGAEAINIGGTENVIAAAQSQEQPPKLFFASSFDVFGQTQHQEPPRKATDPVQPFDDYTRHKAQCEQLVQHSGLTWAIFRFSDMPPAVPPKAQPIMFDIPLHQRFEMLHRTDAALAIVNGIQNDIWEKIWLVGGGKNCQIHYDDYVNVMMERMGVGKLPEEAFTTEPYVTDWLDSTESQALLHYQRHTYDDIINELTRAADPGPLVHVIMPLIRPFVRQSILKMSPYLKQH